jgi:hypothetical protein
LTPISEKKKRMVATSPDGVNYPRRTASAYYSAEMNRRWPLVTGLFIAAALLAFGVRYVLEAQAERVKKTREFAYEAVLRSYSEALKLGATRKEVEDYLRAKDVEFRRMCCVDSKQRFSTNVYDDLTKVGQENAP